MEIGIILIAAYLISVFGAYKYHQKMYYHKKGMLKGLEPDVSDVFAVFWPCANTVISFMLLFGTWKDAKFKKITFFKPNNK